MDERKMYYVQLVLDTPRVMRIPMVGEFTIGKGIVDLVVKKRNKTSCFVFFPVPEVDNPHTFLYRILSDIITGKICSGGNTICRDERTFALYIEFKTMEGTLKVGTNQLACTQRCPPMGALVNYTSKGSFFVPEQDKFQIQALDGT
jgi:hypothetical protein